MQLPLQVRCFSREIFDICSALARYDDPARRLSCVKGRTNQRLVEEVDLLPHANPSLKVTVDLGGLSNSVLASEETSETFLDLGDTRFRASDVVLGKWTQLLELGHVLHCNLCDGGISADVCSLPSIKTNDQDHLSFAICPAPIPVRGSPCLHVAHLTCLAKRPGPAHGVDDIVPQQSLCPSCSVSVPWGMVIRSCFGRRDAVG